MKANYINNFVVKTLSHICKLSLIPLLLTFVLCAPASAEGQDGRKIWPKSSKTTRTGPNGEKSLAIPLRFFVEYGSNSSESEPNPLGDVDIDINRYTVGADFVTSSMWFWGVSLSHIDTDDNGSSVFAPSIVTEKDIGGGSVYLARNITPRVLAGVNVYYSSADGLSIFNMADQVTEDSEFYGFRPFFNYIALQRGGLEVTVGGNVNVNYADFDYVANIPPTASTRNLIGHIPVVVTKKIGRNLKVFGSARLNRILSLEVFDNVPPPDRTTLTLGAGAEYTFENGVSIYARASHDVWDDAYDISRAAVGVSVPFSIFSSRQPYSSQPLK